jgi:hypothetical protein
VQEVSSRTREVHLSYINFLYVYPQHVTLKNVQKGQAVQLQVILRFSDASPPTSTDESHDSSTGGRRDSTSSESGQYSEQTVWSLIQTNDKRLEFCDALRFSLPVVLDATHSSKAHLLFIFHHIDGKKYKRTPIGFAFLPLLREGRFEISEAQEEVSLTVCQELPANYLDEDVASQIKWHQLSPQNVDSTLNVGLYLGLLPAIKQLTIADPFELLRFLPVVLNLLIKVMCSADSNVGKEAFYAMLYLIKTYVLSLTLSPSC